MLQRNMLAQWAFVAVAAASDLAGALLVTTAHQKGLAPLRYFVAGGAGFMLAAAFVRMLPESTQVPHAFLFVLVGYFGVHLFEHTVAPHFTSARRITPRPCSVLRPVIWRSWVWVFTRSSTASRSPPAS